MSLTPNNVPDLSQAGRVAISSEVISRAAAIDFLPGAIVNAPDEFHCRIVDIQRQAATYVPISRTFLQKIVAQAQALLDTTPATSAE